MVKRAFIALMLALPGGLHAQITLPPVGALVDPVISRVQTALAPADEVVRSIDVLAAERLDRLTKFVAQHPDETEFDSAGQPARRGELLVIDPRPDDLAAAQRGGFALIEQQRIEGINIGYARLAVPPRLPLAKAERALRKLLPQAEVTADQLHFQSGSRAQSGSSQPLLAGLPRGGTIGVIDGGVVGGGTVAAQVGFAAGAPHPNAHAQAIRSLLVAAGTAKLYVADVYGTDLAGGNALSLARALGWMAQQRVPVVSISLIGPPNPLVARAVAAAQAGGMVVVAAVGNDGAAAPPAYPASYPNVIAVTGVDGRGRVLLEAGKASHLDYAAPGADITAIGLDGRRVSLRGTSFAAPLAAARIAAHRAATAKPQQVLSLTDAEAVRAGRKTGRGILCGACRSGS
ncbi:S8 family serine peptidase [Novosphingobium sediminis]|nr:S8 family serine peptidase [Novosphingobium sediminis]